MSSIEVHVFAQADEGARAGGLELAVYY